MISDLRFLWGRLNANYWFYPAIFSVLAAVLAVGLIALDRSGMAEGLNKMSWLVPARPDGASNMLTVIAGSMIGVASTVFSITIAAVAYASGNYGPRLLTNFMEDKGNQFSLATFIGTFVYAITVLRTVRAENEVAASAADAAATRLPGFVPQLSLLVAYGLMALSVAVLVYFLNHIPASIRINTVLEGIGKRLLRGIKHTFPVNHSGGEAQAGPDGTCLPASKTGYVQFMELSELESLAEKLEVTIALEVRTGDFLHPGMTLARISDVGGQPTAIDDDLRDRIEKAFTFGATRTPQQDPDFLIDELVEIALRALSPGINDPFTAINAIHWLGAATAEIGQRNLVKHMTEGEQDRRIFPLPDDFDHYLQRGFGAIRGSVATNPIASLVMLDTLRHVAAPIKDESRQRLLRREGARLIEQARLALEGPDLQDVEARHATFDRWFT